MGTNVIEIEGLCKEYRGRGGRRVAAIDGLDLAIPEAGVFGFLGPNGSGKTTTIRCVLGLVRPTRGTVRLLGRPVPGELHQAIRKVGAIVEAPAMFPTLTGRENLRLLGAVDRIGTSRVDEVLGTVGLDDRAGDLVKKYSLGMRQRLALAATLLKDPALLILDEPANGLDPAGIRQVRALLRQLAAEGRTVFVSSHILSEIEHTCDRVAILNRGRCVANGTVHEVLASAGPGNAMLVKVDDLDAGLAVLQRAGLSAERGDGHIRVAIAPTEAERVTQALAHEGQWVTDLRPEERSLEDLFLELTGASDASCGTSARGGTGMNLLVVEMRRALHRSVVRRPDPDGAHRLRSDRRDRVHHLGGQDARRTARRRRDAPRRDARLVDRRRRRRRAHDRVLLPASRGLDRRRNGRRGRVASRHDHDAAHMGAAAGARAPCPHGRVRDPRRAHRARVADRVPRGAGTGRARERIDRRASTGSGGPRSSPRCSEPPC